MVEIGGDADLKEGLNHNGMHIDKEMARANERGRMTINMCYSYLL